MNGLTFDPSVYLQKWNLTGPQELARTPTSHVFLVSFQSRPAVLKVLTELGRNDEASGATALRCYDGKGAVRLLMEEQGAHLLSYADGKSLDVLVVEGKDTEAAHVIGQI